MNTLGTLAGLAQRDIDEPWQENSVVICWGWCSCGFASVDPTGKCIGF